MLFVRFPGKSRESGERSTRQVADCEALVGDVPARRRHAVEDDGDRDEKEEEGD